MTTATNIAVIVVNYGTADLTIAAVDSVLARDHGGRDVTVHVVNNAAPGDDAATLTARHAAAGWGDRVVLHLEDENHGFGRGNNVALQALAAQESPPGYVFLLNPDAQLANEALDLLARTLETTPGAGLAGASVTKPDGTPVTAAFRFPNWVNEFSAALAFGPVARALRRWQVPLPPDQPAGPVDWVVGAAVMFRWEMLEKVGFFDPAYFLYYEEVDLMRQAHLAGYDCLFVPTAQVIHAEGAATGVKSLEVARRRRPAYWYDSWRIYFTKNHGRAGLLLASAAALSGSALGLALARLRGRTAEHIPLCFFTDFWSHVLRRGKLRP